MLQPTAQGGVSASGEAPPHNILFVENLPEATTSNMLSLLFNQYPGYKEARPLPQPHSPAASPAASMPLWHDTLLPRGRLSEGYDRI